MTYDEYRQLLEKLKRNRERVPRELLMSRYREPYLELIRQIRNATSKIVSQMLFDGLICDEAGAGELRHGVEELLKRPDMITAMRRISLAAFRDCDADKVLQIVAEQVEPAVYRDVYTPYWQSRCRKLPDGAFVNDLLNGAKWVPAGNCWISNSDGRCTARFLPAPASQKEVTI